MKRILRRPVTNMVCISMFTAFYALVFLATSRGTQFKSLLESSGAKQLDSPFWKGWSDFLAAGYHVYIAYAMIALTILVVILLILRRHPYDEYHTSLLMQCLAVAAVLTLIAIAVFYLIILGGLRGFVEKFTLFIVVNWTTVVMSNLVFVLLCRWR
jgi:heme exporter protein D